MGLEEFYYMKTAFILNGAKQNVKHLEGNEVQVNSIYEMLKQFPSEYENKFICANLTQVLNTIHSNWITNPANLGPRYRK